jgi:hypothetical protein
MIASVHSLYAQHSPITIFGSCCFVVFSLVKKSCLFVRRSAYLSDLHSSTKPPRHGVRSLATLGYVSRHPPSHAHQLCVGPYTLYGVACAPGPAATTPRVPAADRCCCFGMRIRPLVGYPMGPGFESQSRQFFLFLFRSLAIPCQSIRTQNILQASGLQLTTW